MFVHEVRDNSEPLEWSEQEETTRVNKGPIYIVYLTRITCVYIDVLNAVTIHSTTWTLWTM